MSEFADDKDDKVANVSRVETFSSENNSSPEKSCNSFPKENISTATIELEHVPLQPGAESASKYLLSFSCPA